MENLMLLRLISKKLVWPFKYGQTSMDEPLIEFYNCHICPYLERRALTKGLLEEIKKCV